MVLELTIAWRHIINRIDPKHEEPRSVGNGGGPRHLARYTMMMIYPWLSHRKSRYAWDCEYCYYALLSFPAFAASDQSFHNRSKINVCKTHIHSFRSKRDGMGAGLGWAFKWLTPMILKRVRVHGYVKRTWHEWSFLSLLSDVKTIINKNGPLFQPLWCILGIWLSCNLIP